LIIGSELKVISADGFCPVGDNVGSGAANRRVRVLEVFPGPEETSDVFDHIPREQSQSY
jgi:hypothetical protein